MKEDKRKPGLHRVGPNPWDFEYRPVRGQQVSFVGIDGVTYTEVVKDFTEDEDTGEIKLEFE